MRKLSSVTLFGILALTAWTQQAQSPVEITSEPSHHLVFENMFVRVFAVSVDPGKSTLMHHHGHDYLGITLGDSQITNTKQGAQPAQVSLKDGDTRFTPAGLVHAITNNASVTFHNRTIELLQPTTNQKACTESCEIPVPCDSGQSQMRSRDKAHYRRSMVGHSDHTAAGRKISAAHASGQFPYYSAH